METTNLEPVRYKCPVCYGVTSYFLIDLGDKNKKLLPICPDCGIETTPACIRDHACTCISTIHSGVSYCPECGEPRCPDCGSHNVFVVSRITGYYSNIVGWNAAKQQELRDRVHTNIN